MFPKYDRMDILLLGFKTDRETKLIKLRHEATILI